MKKFLSLVLALAMTLSLVTISAGAKDFADSDELTSEQYEEAVNVMSEMGIIDGYSDGDFRPQGTLTRQAAAKIIACMMLGKTTAESLGTQAAPFKDVPAGSSFAGYIAFCVERGLISGYADGTFRPTGTLTGFAFLKMLLGALGYDSSIEGYTGTNWTVNVAGRAYEIGLTDGNEEFVGSRAATREEAALYAVNTLKATLVEYADKGSNLVINGVEVVQGASEPTYVTSSVYNAASSISADRDNEGMYTVEFAERYQPDLEMTRDTDDFERPSYTWSWKNRDIGTYVDYSLLVAEYTTGVTGRELYNVLTASTIRNADLLVYVDGGEAEGSEVIAKSDLVRSNNNDVGITDNGVLTQVFVDTDANDGDGEITIASINTYLAQATADYSERQERLALNVFVSDPKGVSRTVDLEDVAGIEDVTEDQFVLVNMSDKDRSRLEVVDVMDCEVLTDSTITKWSSATDPYVVSKLTTGGTQYDAAAKAFYDDDTLESYDEQLLTDMTYNVYLDQYGYVIGVELYEGTLNYVFVTGYDLNSSNISVRTATAAAIFLDGNMSEITVDVRDTNDNIKDAKNTYFSEWTNANNEASTDGNNKLNRWYSYTVDADGVYTLKPVKHFMATAYDVDTTINCSSVRLNEVDGYYDSRSYGNDDSIFITVELGKVDTSKAGVITDVEGVYTGVQDVDIELYSNRGDLKNSIYTVYDDDNYIIASIVLGEAQGSVANYAYILSGAKSEEKIDDTYYWEFDAVVGGEIVTLTAESKYDRTIDDLQPGHVQELRYTGEYVTAIKDVKADDIYSDNTKNIVDEEVYDVGHVADYDGRVDDDCETDDCQNRDASVGDYPESTRINGTLVLEGRTLYTSTADVGLTFVREAPAVVIQNENGKTVESAYSSVSEAIGTLADADERETAPGLQFQGRIVAILNSQGVAEWVVIISDTDVETGLDPDYDDDNNMDITLSGSDTVDGQPTAGAKVTLSEAADRDLTFKVDVYMVNGGSRVYLNTVSVKVAKDATDGFTAISGLANGQQYLLVCGDETALMNG